MKITNSKPLLLAAVMLLASSSAIAQSNVNTTVQEGRVNINLTRQCGEANDNATYQDGRVNINRTVQGGCGRPGRSGGMDRSEQARGPQALPSQARRR